MVHVSVKAEEILRVLGLSVTNSMLLSWIVMGAFAGIGVYYARSLTRRKKSHVFYLLHTIVMAIYQLIQSVLHDKTALFFPLLGAYFFYILLNNWTGMLPTVGSVLVRPLIAREQSALVDNLGQESAGKTETDGHVQYAGESSSAEDREIAVVQEDKTHETASDESGHGLIPLLRANTADLNTTFALALITVVMIQYFGLKYNGLGYLRKFFTIAKPFPVMTFVGLLELISELARILSFSFRLFGNVLAGEILITIVAFLLPPIASFIMLPFFTLEIMAGAIQALVFTMLSTVLVGMATAKVHH